MSNDSPRSITCKSELGIHLHAEVAAHSYVPTVRVAEKSIKKCFCSSLTVSEILRPKSTALSKYAY